jgi:uncharacterized membrane protein
MGVFDIFLEPVFWIFMGFLYALVGYSAPIWANDLGLKMNWWKWVLAALWFVLLSMSIAGGFTLIGENEPEAGIYFLGSAIVVNIILGVILWRILNTGNKQKQESVE